MLETSAAHELIEVICQQGTGQDTTKLKPLKPPLGAEEILARALRGLLATLVHSAPAMSVTFVQTPTQSVAALGQVQGTPALCLGSLYPFCWFKVPLHSNPPQKGTLIYTEINEEEQINR